MTTNSSTTPPTSEQIKQERLNHTRAMILLIRNALQNPDTMVSISLDGVSEQWMSRTDLLAELKAWEREEDKLMGTASRIRYADLSRLNGR